MGSTSKVSDPIIGWPHWVKNLAQEREKLINTNYYLMQSSGRSAAFAYVFPFSLSVIIY